MLGEVYVSYRVLYGWTVWGLICLSSCISIMKLTICFYRGRLDHFEVAFAAAILFNHCLAYDLAL